MKAEPLVAGKQGEDRSVLVSGVVVENDVDGFALRDPGLDRLQEANELFVALTLHAAADDVALQDVEHRNSVVVPFRL